MKYITIPLAILLLIVLIGALNTQITDSRISDMVDMLDLCETYVDAGDWDTAEQFAMQAMSRWDSAQFYLSVIARHSELDEVDATVDRTIESFRCRDYTLFKTENTVLIGMLEHIAEMEELDLKNIL